jgi:hypothetical protein
MGGKAQSGEGCATGRCWVTVPGGSSDKKRFQKSGAVSFTLIFVIRVTVVQNKKNK